MNIKEILKKLHVKKDMHFYHEIGIQEGINEVILWTSFK